MNEWGQVANGVVRAFVAVELPSEVRDALVDYIKRLQRIGAHVGWTTAENLHVTLVFLGDIGSHAVCHVATILDEVSVNEPMFNLDCTGVGTFGSPRSPRIIWAGIEDHHDRLRLFQARLVERLRTEGYPLEERPFHAHVTLGRVRSPRGVQDLTSVLGSDKRTRFGGFRVERVLLMRSQLGSHGPTYMVLHASPMKGAKNL